MRGKRGGEKERDIFHACTFARYYPFLHFPLLQFSVSLIGFSCISVDPSVSQPTGSKHWQKKMKVKLSEKCQVPAACCHGVLHVRQHDTVTPHTHAQ